MPRTRRRTVIIASCLSASFAALFWVFIGQYVFLRYVPVKNLRIDDEYSIRIESESEWLEPNTSLYCTIYCDGKEFFGPKFFDAVEQDLFPRAAVTIAGADSGPIVAMVDAERPYRIHLLFDRATGQICAFHAEGHRVEPLLIPFCRQTGNYDYQFDWKLPH